MGAEFRIVFEDLVWYKHNQGIVKGFISSLETFQKVIDDDEYWLRGDEEGGNWAYGARIFIRPQDIFFEISCHPPSIVSDLKKLTRFIADKTISKVVDDDGERIDCYD